jgi:enamine deaminase RidA (YjgF/YER057c/UK114 family)
MNAPSSKRRLISSGSLFEQRMAYSRAVVQGDWVFVSGTTGFDYSRMTIEEGIEKQTEQCFENIRHALEQAGSSLADVVRVHYLLPNADDFERAWPAMQKYLGSVRPAATMMVVGLVDPRMKIEIEVTAYLGG